MIASISLLTACGGGGGAGISNTGIIQTSSEIKGTKLALNAYPDTISTVENIAVNIPVLVNDSGITDTVVLSVIDAPNSGNAVILADNTITYTPNPSYTGNDSFTYKVTINDSIAITTVSIGVRCTGCAQDITLTLRWDPSPSNNDIGYLIYYGNNVNNIDTLAFNLSQYSGLNPDAPSIELSAINDLQLNSGDNVCFRISAYTPSLVSSLSTPICGII